MPFRPLCALLLLAPAAVLNAAPSLSYSTLLGGSAVDAATAVATDREGNTIVIGNTDSVDFLGLTNAPNRGGDVFLVKLDPTGRVLFKRYLGGSDLDGAIAVTTGAAGDIYVTGTTLSPDFPMANALDSTIGAGNYDAFLTRFDSNGNIAYSTYLGGSGSDQGLGVAVDGEGNVLITGMTSSTNFPMKNAIQTVYPAGVPMTPFVTKLNAAGTELVYSTYYGGNGEDAAISLDVDAAGNAYVAGVATSTLFPVKDGFQSKRLGPTDCFLLKIDPAGALVYATLFGGGGTEKSFDLDVEGDSVFLAGWTDSANFPVKGALIPSRPSTTAGFVARFTTAGALVYSTYLGGSDVSQATGVAANAAGSAVVIMRVHSGGLPEVNGLQEYRGQFDAYVVQLDSTGTTRLFATYFGGKGLDSPQSVAWDARGGVVFCGFTDGSEFPVLNAAQATINGHYYDAWAARINLGVLGKRRAAAH